jgi:hypothetical protein
MRSLLPIFFAIATACHGADVLTVTFSPSTKTGLPGDTVPFFGTLTNTTNGVLNLDGVSILFPAGPTIDENPFFANTPPSLAAFESTGLVELLDVLLPNNQGPGTLDGVLTVVGNSQNLGSGDFHLTVNSTIPEPGSLWLMAGGLASLLCRWRRKR